MRWPLRKVERCLVLIALALMAAIGTFCSHGMGPSRETVSARLVKEMMASEKTDVPRTLNSVFFLKLKDFAIANRSLVRDELVSSYDLVVKQIGREDIASVWNWNVFLSELDRGNYLWTIKWLAVFKVESFNSVPIEYTVCKGLRGVAPAQAIYVFLDLARSGNSEVSSYARQILYRAFENILSAASPQQTCSSDDLLAIESALFDSQPHWTIDPGYPARWEAAMLEGKSPGGLLLRDK